MTVDFKSGDITFHFNKTTDVSDTDFAKFVAGAEDMLRDPVFQRELTNTSSLGAVGGEVNVNIGTIALTNGHGGGETVPTSYYDGYQIAAATINININPDPADATSVQWGYSIPKYGADPVPDNVYATFANEVGDVAVMYNPSIHVHDSSGPQDGINTFNNVLGQPGGGTAGSDGITTPEDIRSIQDENYWRGVMGWHPILETEHGSPYAPVDAEGNPIAHSIWPTDNTTAGGGSGGGGDGGSGGDTGGGGTGGDSGGDGGYSPSPEPPDMPDPVKDLLHDFETGSIKGCPLVLDISGDGIGLSTLGGPDNVYWDFAGDGVKHASAWTTGGTGFLAIDLNGNGSIDNNTELFGNQPSSGIANGFQALAVYDSNSDGVIDSSDAQFTDLRVWVDTDQDGVSQASELHTLSDLSITSINLGYSTTSYEIGGNDIKQESTFVINGQTRAIVDAWLEYDPMNTTSAGSGEINPDAIYEPYERGYGSLASLTIAMSENNTLLDMVDDLASKTARELFTESYDLRGKIQAIMYEWAGVTDDPSNTWPYYGTTTADTRRVEFLNEITGTTITDTGAVHFGYTWDLAVGIIGGDLLLQSGLKDLFGDPTFNSMTGTFTGGDLEGTTVFRFIPLEDYATNIWNSTYNDVYVVMPGDMAAGGHTIMDPVGGGTDTLLIGGVDKEDVHLWTDGSGNLVVQYTSTDQITLGGGLALNGASTVSDHVERIMFDDGTLWDLTQGLKLIDDDTGRMLNGSNHDDTLLGGTGSNYIYGDDGNDTLSGGGGTDHLYGNAGNDTYLFSDTTTATTTNVSEAAGEGTDTIRVDGNAGDVAFWIDSSGGHLTFDGTHEMLIATTNSGGVDLGSRIEHIVFNDATDWDFTSGLYENDNGDSHELDGGAGNDVLHGNGGNDYLYDYGGNDTLDGGDGSNTLHGGTGDDTYLFSDAGGTTIDRVVESTGEGTDTIRVDGNAGDVRFWVDGSGGHLVFDSTHEMLIDTSNSGGVDLGSRIEHIVFNDATDWSFTSGLYENDTDDSHELDGGAGNDVLHGNGGNDYLYDYAGNDTLDGGTGTNTLHGGSGDDTYLFSDAGGSTTTYVQESTGDGTDTVRVDANAADAAFWVDGSGVGHIVLDSSHEMILQTSGFDLGSRIEQIVYNDGSLDLTGGLVESDTNDAHELDGTSSNDVLRGNGGNDSLWAYAGDDTLAGGDGADVLHGGSGADTFVFDHATAYNNVDVVADFSVSDGDKLDLRDLLASYDPMTDVLSDFVKVENDAAGGTAVSVDQDGTGTGYGWVQIATLSGVTGLDADTLASTGHLLAA